MSRDHKKQRTRTLILETAQQLFQRDGYDSVSTRMIARECGVAIGTVFSHFKDKPTLTLALFHQRIDARLAQHSETMALQREGLGYFLSMAEFFYEFYAEDRAFSIALMQTALFDLNYFEQQLEGFIKQVAERLQSELPDNTETQRLAVARAWFGYYVFHLLTGLSSEQTVPAQWLAGLSDDCKTLLSVTEWA